MRFFVVVLVLFIALWTCDCGALWIKWLWISCALSVGVTEVVDILGEGEVRAQNGEKIYILCPLFFFVFSVVEVSLRRFLLRQCIFATIVGYCYGRCGSFLFLVVINC